MKSGGVVAFVTLTLAWTWVDPAVAQNDWQFPDPYFGILEIEKKPSVRAGPRSSESIRGAAEVGRQRIGRGLFRSVRKVGRGKGQSAVTDATVK